MSRMTRPRSTERGSSAWRRAKASSWPVRREPRATAPIAFCSRSAQLGIGLALGAGHRQVEIGADDLQQVVEVMRHAAGQMADGFHLLRLAHRAFGAHARGHVHHATMKPPVGTGAL